jgi:competence protein ComEC
VPFWDRDIEMIVLTHPQKDHMEGLISVLDNYQVKTIVWTGVNGEGGLFSEWEIKIKTEGAKVYIAHSGEKLVIDDLTFDVLSPSREKLEEWKLDPPADLNDSSVVIRVNFKAGNNNYCAYYTGDIPKEILEGLISKPCQILKISPRFEK